MRDLRRNLFARSRVSLGQLAERQLRFLIRQRKADKHILAAELAPQRVRRPLLRLEPAQALNPDKVPLAHQRRPNRRATEPAPRVNLESTLFTFVRERVPTAA